MKSNINKGYSNYDLKTKSKVFTISLILYFIFLIVVTITKETLVFHIFVDNYSSAVSAVLIMVGIFTKINNQNSFIKYLSIGLIFICIFTWVHTEIIVNISSLFLEKYYNTLSIISNSIFYTIVIFDQLVIGITIFAYKRKIRYKKLMFIYFILITVMLFVYIKIMNMENVLISIFIVVNIVLLVIITVFNIFEMYKLKSESNFTYYKYALMYISLIFLYGITNLFKSDNLGEYYILIKFTFRYFAYVSIFVFMEKSILRTAYNMQLAELKKVQQINKKNNNRLKRREKLLTDLENRLRRSSEKRRKILDNIRVGVLIFENDILQYKNKQGVKYFSNIISDIKEVNSLQMIISYILNGDCNKYKFKEPIIREINFEDKRILEVRITPLESNKVLIVVKDNTYIYKYLDMKKEYDTYLKDEEINEEFYSIISHELRTPINVIYSALQLNEVMLKQQNCDVIKRNNKIIKSNCNRLIRTINNFIDSNKITDGYLYGNKSVINLVSLIDDIVEASIKYFEKKSNELIFDPQDEEIYIQCNYEHMNRIILNLLSNALKYGVSNTEMFIITTKMNKKVAIDVRYKGNKIPEEKMMYIFEKFTKLDKYLTSRSEGSGLGLFLTKKLVEQNGGTIEILTQKEETLFRIILPIIENVDYYDRNEYNLATISQQVDIEFSDIYF